MDNSLSMRREIVFEIEQVKRIRKRAWSQVRFCTDCGCDADFISLREAAEIFEQGVDELTEFLRSHGCHTMTRAAETDICLIALLDAIDKVTANSRYRLRGD